MGIPQTESAAFGVRALATAIEKLQHVSYQPFYSTANLLGYADRRTHLLNPQKIPFFRTQFGQDGQGFDRPLKYSETNHVGQGSNMPANAAFLGLSFGVLLPEVAPDTLKRHLLIHSDVQLTRYGQLNHMGPIRLWPESGYGLQSKAAAGGSALLTYSTNGAVAARQFPTEGALYFPPSSRISFEIEILEAVYLTADGKPFNGKMCDEAAVTLSETEGVERELKPGNGLRSCNLQVSLEGWHFEPGV